MHCLVTCYEYVYPLPDIYFCDRCVGIRALGTTSLLLSSVGGEFASSGRDLTLLSSKSSIVAVTAFSGDVLVCRCLNRIAMFGRTVYYWWNINPTFTIPLEMSDYQNLTNDLMVGYLFYDTISEIFVMGNLDLLMLGHHVVGLASHVTCRINSLGACAYYHMMVYIAEASTPFLHISYILKSNDMKDSALFKVCVLLLLILFLLVRLLWGPFMQYDLHMRQEHWFLTVAGKALYWPNVACVLFFNLVNFTWGQKLFLIAYKSVTGGGEEDETPPKKAKGSRGKAKDKGKKRD